MGTNKRMKGTGTVGDSGAIEGSIEVLIDKWMTVHVVLKGI
jgi:hypothetical protein